jgi:hypothetical protein
MAMLTACSGGGVDVAIQGTTNSNLPPLTPARGSEAIVAHGEITGLGDFTLNDVRYQIGFATVTVNGEPASISDLRQGQIVTLNGRINDDGRTGTANSIRFDANVVGLVDGIDASNKQLVVMGQTVTTDADTYFGDGIDPETYAGLAVGDVAQISGHTDASGAIRATRIDPAPSNAKLQVTGTVAGLDIANLLFRINRLTVDYGDALVIDLPGGAPANAMQVKVFGTISASRFAVERLVAAPEMVGDGGQRVQTAGVVTRFSSAADFDVDHLNVRADAATAYQNGNASDLDLDAELVIDGSFASNGHVVADRVTFGHLAVNTARLTYGYRDFTGIAVPTVFAVNVSQGSEFSVEVFVDSGYEDRIDVTQSGSTLTIALLPGNGNIHTLEAFITMPVLEQIDLSGVVSASLYDFDQPQMTINVGGVSHLRGDALRIGNLTSRVIGVSRMDLVDVRPIGNANITVSGVSKATLNMGVGATMTGSVSTGPETGASTLFYYGTNVDVNVTTDALSSILRLGDTRP